MKKFSELKIGDSLYIAKRKGIKYEYIEKGIKNIKKLKTKPMKITLDDCEYEIKIKNINGEWQIIDGKTIWINEFYYHFLNYYRANTINFSKCWDSQWFYDLLLADSFYAPDVLGLLYFKGRRGGGTAGTAALGAPGAVGNANYGPGIGPGMQNPAGMAGGAGPGPIGP